MEETQPRYNFLLGRALFVASILLLSYSLWLAIYYPVWPTFVTRYHGVFRDLGLATIVGANFILRPTSRFKKWLLAGALICLVVSLAGSQILRREYSIQNKIPSSDQR